MNFTDFIKSKTEKIPKPAKSAFIVSLIVGLICHFVGLTNQFLIYDSIHSHHSLVDNVTSGRFLLHIFGEINGGTHLVWVNGLTILFWVACSCAVITLLLEIKSTHAASLIAAIITAFPTVTYLFMYSFTGDVYSFALFCSVLALLVTKLHKYGFLIGALLICVSLAIYQAFIVFAAVLCLLIIILDSLTDNLRFKLYGKFILCGAVGSIVYLIINKIILTVSNAAMSDYQNLNFLETLNIDLSLEQFYKPLDILYTVIFKQRLLTGTGLMNILALAVFVILIICTGFSVKSIIKAKTSIKKPKNINQLVVVFALFLFIYSLNILVLITDAEVYHVIMQLQYVLIPVGFVYILYKSETGDKPSRKYFNRRFTTSAAACLLVFTFGIRANLLYSRHLDMNINMLTSYTKISYTIENTEGFVQGMDTVVFNFRGNAQDHSRVQLSDEVAVEFLNIYCRTDLNLIESDKKADEIFDPAYIAGDCKATVKDNVLYLMMDTSGMPVMDDIF
ncbi:MAG: glucosyltransferase domain-containing protein [Ruminococcus sp.]|nr:glucosyltransferase domain-containing protein [Ruminococcus sp.]